MPLMVDHRHQGWPKRSQALFNWQRTLFLQLEIVNLPKAPLPITLKGFNLGTTLLWIWELDDFLCPSAWVFPEDRFWSGSLRHDYGSWVRFCWAWPALTSSGLSSWLCVYAWVARSEYLSGFYVCFILSLIFVMILLKVSFILLLCFLAV